MTNSVVLETNWLIDVTLHRDATSRAIDSHARAGRLEVYLPSFCMTEAIKALESTQRGLRQLENSMAQFSNELRRYQAVHHDYEQLIAARRTLLLEHDRMESMFWSGLSDIMSYARLLEMTRETIQATSEIRSQLKLSPADAAVMATLIVSARAGGCRTFLSHDQRAFGPPDVQVYLQVEGISYFGNYAAFLRRCDLPFDSNAAQVP